MKLYEREEIKAMPELKYLMDQIIKIHKILPPTQEKLSQLKLPELCAEDRHYYTINIDDTEYYLSYDTQSNYREETNSIGVRIKNIAIYDNFIEFEGARIRDYNKNPDESVGTGLGLN